MRAKDFRQRNAITGAALIYHILDTWKMDTYRYNEGGGR
jgi:hypothetical protein